jgi:hypothetical protein
MDARAGAKRPAGKGRDFVPTAQAIALVIIQSALQIGHVNSQCDPFKQKAVCVTFVWQYNWQQ